MHLNVTIVSVRRIQGVSAKSGNDYDFDSIMALVDGLDPVEMNVSAAARPPGGFVRGQNVDIEVNFAAGSKVDLIRVLPPVQAAKAS